MDVKINKIDTSVNKLNEYLTIYMRKYIVYINDNDKLEIDYNGFHMGYNVASDDNAYVVVRYNGKKYDNITMMDSILLDYHLTNSALYLSNYALNGENCRVAKIMITNFEVVEKTLKFVINDFSQNKIFTYEFTEI